MSLREEQCKKVCRILDDVLANRPTERDSLIVAVRKAFESLEQFGNAEQLPSAQPEPLSDAYTKAVWTWLLEYQIKAAELKGRYTPYEVLSWVANDWRKEHERSDCRKL